MTYTVKCKRHNYRQVMIFENVICDGVMKEAPYRYFILEDKRRVEVPMDQFVFEFSPEREKIIELNQQKGE